MEDDKGTDGDGPHTRLTRIVVPRPDYKQSPWANMLRNQDLLDSTSRAAKLFCRRFRVPHVFFLTLVRRVIEEGWFPTAEVDVVARPCIPVTLKVSNFTQYLLNVDSGVDNTAVDMNDSVWRWPQPRAAVQTRCLLLVLQYIYFYTVRVRSASNRGRLFDRAIL